MTFVLLTYHLAAEGCNVGRRQPAGSVCTRRESI